MGNATGRTVGRRLWIGRKMNSTPRGFLVFLGDMDLGQTLTARPNGITDADGMGPGSFQWTRDGVVIDGATGETYTITEADQGKEIGVRLQYTDGDGNQETVVAKPKVVPDPVADAMTAIYFLVFNRAPDRAGAAFYAGHWRNGAPLSLLVKDMEDNKAKGAR